MERIRERDSDRGLEKGIEDNFAIVVVICVIYTMNVHGLPTTQLFQHVSVLSFRQTSVAYMNQYKYTKLVYPRQNIRRNRISPTEDNC